MKKRRLLNTSEYKTEQSIVRALEGSAFQVRAQLPMHVVMEPEQQERLPKPLRRHFQDATFDFVVFNEKSLPEFVVEFDGPFHQLHKKKQQADERKNRLCQLAGLPIFRIGDDYLKEHEHTSILEYIIGRFVAWRSDCKDMMSSHEHGPGPIEHDIEGSLSDPTVIFDCEHPFPAAEVIAGRLHENHAIYSPQLSHEKWKTIDECDNPIEFESIGGGQMSDGHYLRVVRRYELSHRHDHSELSRDKHTLHEFEVDARGQCTLPVDVAEKKSDGPSAAISATPLLFHAIPGIDMFQLLRNYCDYIALKRLEDWLILNPKAADRTAS